MACNCISRVEKLIKEKTNESGCLDTGIGVPSGIAMVNIYGMFHKQKKDGSFCEKWNKVNILPEIRIGAQSPIKKDRYDPDKFVGFVIAVKTLARGLDCRFIVKDSMYKQAETFEGAYRDLCVRNLDEIKKIYELKQKENDEK